MEQQVQALGMKQTYSNNRGQNVDQTVVFYAFLHGLDTQKTHVLQATSKCTPTS